MRCLTDFVFFQESKRLLQARIAFRRALRNRADRLGNRLPRAWRCRSRIFLQQHFGQILDLGALRGELVSQGLLDLRDKLWARAALLVPSVLVIDDKCKDSKCPTGDDGYSAAEP
jgi:hypothetical protein